MKTDLKLFALLLVFSGAELSWAASGQKSKPTHIATFNTALNPRIGNYNTRRLLIPEKLTKLNAEVACLQEVYFSRDMDAIIGAMKIERRFPYMYSAAHEKVTVLKEDFRSGFPCNSEAFKDKFTPCVAANCTTLPNEMEQLKCAIECGIFTLPQECVSCLSMADPANSIETCGGESGYRYNEGGVMILSERELKNVEVKRYENGKLLMPRTYIFAEVDGIGNIVCTFNTPYLGPVYFEALNYSSWAAQNLAEAKQVVEYLKDYPEAIVMGDLSTSPNLPQAYVSPGMKESFDYYLENNYKSPYTEDGPGYCTYCVENPLAQTSENYTMDHILLKNMEYSDVERIFDDEDLEDLLSDHYGLKMTFKNE